MKSKKCFLLIMFFIMLNIMCLHAQSFWPDNKKAAIVLTYDDGLASHRKIVIPQLDAKGFKGTFYLYGQTLSVEDMPEWRIVSRNGHELGNHSVYHPCSGRNEKTLPCSSLDDYSVETILREISVMNGFLYAIDGNTVRTFAYPCGNTTAGGDDFSEPLRSSGLVCFARGGGGDPLIADIKSMNFFKVPTLSANTGESSDRLIDFVKNVVKNGGVGVFVFHGVGGDYLDISAEVHQEFIDYLDENSSDIWVAPFIEVMKHIKK
jgi:Predicted xylanase/chitin deacetylase